MRKEDKERREYKKRERERERRKDICRERNSERKIVRLYSFDPGHVKKKKITNVRQRVREGCGYTKACVWKKNVMCGYGGGRGRAGEGGVSMTSTSKLLQNVNIKNFSFSCREISSKTCLRQSIGSQRSPLDDT